MTNLHETDRLVERLQTVCAVAAPSYEGSEIRILCRDALRALTAMGGKAEPVAWRYRDAWGRWAYCEAVDNLNGPTVITEKQALYLASPVQARTGEVTDEMVERACVGYWPSHWAQQMSETDKTSIRVHMRKALEAALSSNESNKQ